MPIRFPRLPLAILVLLLTVASSAQFRAGAFAREDPKGSQCENEHIRAELVTDVKTVQPGTSFLAGLKFVVADKWHIYWENPGENGLPTTYKWKLPTGWTVTSILWPAPARSEMFGSISYGYEGTFVLPARITVPPTASDGKARLVLEADWLVCHDQCLPADCPAFEIDVVVAKDAPEATAHKPLFDAATRLAPVPLPQGTTAEVEAVERALEFRVQGEGPWSADGADLYVYVLQEVLAGGKQREVVNANVPQPVRRDGAVTVLTLPFPKARKAAPARVKGMFVVEKAGERHPFAFDLAVKGAPEPPPGGAAAPPKDGAKPGEPPPGAPAEPAPEAPVEPVASNGEASNSSAGVGDKSGSDKSLLVLLFFAFVGGLILNLMPCVLPVLSIKILGFVSQADEDPVRVRRHGYVFAAGVLASFWILAGAILAFKAAGDEVGWGFQLQYAGTNVALAALMVAVGLNLFGVFEMGTSVMNLAGSAAGKIHSGGYAGSFWSGMLATAIATPCSAPFMAPAVGYAVTAPAIESLLLFTFLGAGMALPYVLLTANPKLLKKVPRPGPWMETFKRLLAFPMFGVAAWLVGVVGAQTGVDGVEWLLYGLVVLGIGLWVYGHWGTPERPPNVRRIVGYGVALIVIACSVVLMVLACLQEPKDAAVFVDDEASSDLPIGPPSEEWEDWSPSLVKRYLKAGYPVFVDYTADWCLSCKFYERTALYVGDFEDLTSKHQVAKLKADYTVRESARGKAILKSLKSFGRSGVPLYVAYSPAPNSNPEFHDGLTPQLALDMVTRAATHPGVPIRTASAPPTPPAPPEPPANGK